MPETLPLAAPALSSIPRGSGHLGPANAPRLLSLDLLRGFAILGILLMNTQSMSMPSMAYYDPTYYGTPNTLNYVVWGIIHVLADVKLLTIFSMLFGAGLVIQTDRVAQRGGSPAAVHYRRMLALLLIGFIHAYLVWYGDVLVSYVFCGVLLFPFRKLPASLLLVMGVLFISVAMYVRYAETTERSETIEKVIAAQERIYGDYLTKEGELKVYRGGWWGQMDNRVRVSFANETTWFVLWGFWRYGGSMLVGMGLLRMRFFHGDWPVSTYRTMAAMLIPIGWSLTIAGILYNIAHGWDTNDRYAYSEMFNYFGSLIAALGYLSVGVLVARRVTEGALLPRILAAPLRAVGMTALSNYIMEGLICTTIFYGHGLGWFGYMTRIQLVGVVLCVWAFQLMISMIWLRFFRQGPLEWGWHWLAHGQAKA